MKKTIVMAAVALATSFTSCGSSQKASSVDYQKERYNQEQQQYERPTRKLRQELETERLATEDCDKWRALGTSSGFVEKTVRNEAQRDGRNQLAQMMKVAVEGAAQDYEQNLQRDLKSSSAALGEAVMSQFVSEEVKNSRAIKFDVFDLSDGSIQVYVCMEIRGTKDDFQNRLNNALERDKLIETQYDRDRFIEKMSQGLEEYKKKQQER